jgi:hypothetical protein
MMFYTFGIVSGVVGLFTDERSATIVDCWFVGVNSQKTKPPEMGGGKFYGGSSVTFSTGAVVRAKQESIESCDGNMLLYSYHVRFTIRLNRGCSPFLSAFNFLTSAYHLSLPQNL